MQIRRAHVKSLCNHHIDRTWRNRTAVVGALGLLLGAAGCSETGGGASMGTTDPAAGGATAVTADALSGVIGPEGGTLTGGPGSAMAGVSLKIPAGALATPTQISIVPTDPAS